MQGVRTIENWWDGFSRTTQPSLTPELVLAGRADQAAALLLILEEETRVTTVSAPSADDVLAFVAATLLSSPEPDGNDLLPRTLIVYDAVSLRRLDATTDLLVLLPYDDELRREARLVQSHHVIFLAPEDVPSDITVPPVDRDAFTAAAGQCWRRGEVCGAVRAGLLTVAWSRFNSESPRGAPCGLVDAFNSKVVRRAWLAGGWQEAKSGDTDALTLLFGASYDDSRDELEPFASGEDPIFTVVGGTWGLTSAEQAWRFGGAQLTGPDALRLRRSFRRCSVQLIRRSSSGRGQLGGGPSRQDAHPLVGLAQGASYDACCVRRVRRRHGSVPSALPQIGQRPLSRSCLDAPTRIGVAISGRL